MKRTDRLTKLIAIILFLAFAAYAGVYAFRTLSGRVVTAEVSLSTVSSGAAASGIVIRDELLLESSEKYIDLTVSDGDKVSGGGRIALAMSSEAGLERTSRMKTLESEIARISSALAGAGTGSDLSTRDQNLKNAVLSLAGAVSRGDCDGIDASALGLGSLLQSQGSATESELAALRAELSSLKNSSSADTSEITAAQSGTFSSIVDGYEHLTSNDVTHMTPARIRSMIDSREEVPDDVFGKLITSFYWYFAAVMSSDDAENLEVGRYASLDFGRYCSVPLYGRVMSISPAEHGSVAVVFRLDEALDETLGMREATAEIAFEEYSGVRIPAEAVFTDDDGQTYVWAVTAMQLERKNINVIYTGDGFVIVEREARSDALREGNTIVVSGDDLYEGKLME